MRIKPTIKEVRSIVGEFLEAEAAYRRDLGGFGVAHKTTKRSAHNLNHSLRVMRAWYSSRFPKIADAG